MSDSLSRTVHAICEIVRNFEPLLERAKALGIFTNDRELLECTHCGMVEDVISDGHLITYRDGDEIADSGLRFTPVNNGRYRCPGCGAEVTEPVDTEEE